jgi:hypothetical protein
MISRASVGAVVGGLGLVVSSTLMGGAAHSAPRASEPAVVRDDRPWARHLAIADEAAAAGDVTHALAAWHDAYGAALGSRRWEGFADAGDAYLRLTRAAGVPTSGVPRARELYLSALFRARDARSLEGVLRIADAFEALGDHEVTRHAVKMAAHLAVRGASPELQRRLSTLEQHTAAPAL